MQFSTKIDISSLTSNISYDKYVMVLGSCFAENMAKMLTNYQFNAYLNPFGIQYNPLSIAATIERMLNPVPFSDEDLIESNGVVNSWWHHSRFAATSREECLTGINEKLQHSSAFFRRTDRCIITFGTAYAYYLKEDGRLVSNCHKQPDRTFRRERLNIDKIVNVWKDCIDKMLSAQPCIKIIFTVSPIRHWKDSAHSNQLSKASLLLAIDQLKNLYPNNIEYFPSYEIMMDELRDYRYYAEDMLHPSSVAVKYIWQRFCDTAIDKETQTVMKNVEEINKALHHIPFQPQAESYKKFLEKTIKKTNLLAQKHKTIDLSGISLLLNEKLLTYFPELSN